jgi:hypothetical protein
MKIVTFSIVLLIPCFLMVQHLFAWHVTVKNDTPFDLQANCKKVGAIDTDWKKISAYGQGDAGCGGADCPKGVEVKVTVPSMPNPIKVETDWDLACGNNDIRVFLVPQYQNKKLTGFKIALGVDIAISDVTVPA